MAFKKTQYIADPRFAKLPEDLQRGAVWTAKEEMSNHAEVTADAALPGGPILTKYEADGIISKASYFTAPDFLPAIPRNNVFFVPYPSSEYVQPEVRNETDDFSVRVRRLDLVVQFTKPQPLGPDLADGAFRLAERVLALPMVYPSGQRLPFKEKEKFDDAVCLIVDFGGPLPGNAPFLCVYAESKLLVCSFVRWIDAGGWAAS